MSEESGLDAVNRGTWERSVGEYADLDSWTDPGERAAVRAVAGRARGARILDVGVGAGRTAWILPLLSAQYVAVDYTGEMVATARRSHPDLDIRTGDARELTDFPDSGRDLVVFSWNGLDALDHADRGRALDEFHRVLRPGGALLYSTLNKDGRAFRQTPRDRRRSEGSVLRRAMHAVRRPGATFARRRRETANWRHLARRIEDHGEWGIGPLVAHDFGLLVHYSTLAGVRRELAEHGFALDAVFADSGEAVDPDAPSTDALYLHMIATRDGGGSP